MITGGAAQRGSVGETVAIRSATSWRAVSRSVPRSKIISICDSCSTDFERIVEIGNAVERLLHRDGHQGFDLDPGEPEGEGLDLDARGSEFREHIHRHVPQLLDAEEHQVRGSGRDDVSEPQARASIQRSIAPSVLSRSWSRQIPNSEPITRARRPMPPRCPRPAHPRQVGQAVVVSGNDDLGSDEDEGLRVRVDPCIAIHVHPDGGLRHHRPTATGGGRHRIEADPTGRFLP